MRERTLKMKEAFAKKAVFLVMVLALACILPVCVQAAGGREESMVVVFAMDSDGEPQYMSNGFLLSQSGGNAIVVTENSSYWGSAAQIQIGGPGIEGMTVALRFNNDEAGVAVMDTQDSSIGFSENNILRIGEMMQNQIIYQSGMRLDIKSETLEERIVYDESRILAAEEIDGFTYVQMQNDYANTLQGGPVFSEDGRLGGFMVQKDSRMDLFIPIDYFVVNEEQSGGTQDDGHGGSSGGTQDDGHGGSSGGTQDDGHGGSSGGTQDDGQSGSSGGYEGGAGGMGTGYRLINTPLDAFLMALIPLFAVVFIISLVVYSGKESARKARGDEEFANVLVRGGEEGLRLKGLGGAFADMYFPINDPITLGRDPECCSIIYPPESAGISRKHCIVRPENGSMTLMDLGSTYGTFVHDGIRLEPNTPYMLKYGDEFYLGNKNNGFRVV